MPPILMFTKSKQEKCQDVPPSTTNNEASVPDHAFMPWITRVSRIAMSSRMSASNNERHRTERIGWLRAAVLGANDGILSTSSLMLGVAAAHATHSSVLVAGVAGLVAGAMSMAAGEYVSVHSQADTEKADLKLERAELKADNKGEHKELAAIYVARGLDPALAKQVAQQLMAHDAIGAHARDELGISEALRARPIQAALASAGSFAVGESCLSWSRPWPRQQGSSLWSLALRWCSSRFWVGWRHARVGQE